MSDRISGQELPIEFLSEFQDKLRYAEEKYRYITDPAAKINGLLREIAQFYDGDNAFLVEIDWDLGMGVCTFAQRISGVHPEVNVLKQLPLDHFSLWIKKIQANQPVIMDLDLLGNLMEERHRIAWEGLRKILVAPFSNRFNTGIIAVGNPQKYDDNLTFLMLLSYAVVTSLNEKKLLERVNEAVKQNQICPDKVVDVSCFGGLTIRTAKGILTDETITADQCYRLLAFLICNYKKARPVRELADIIWNDAPISDPYRDLKNVVYRLKRFLGIVELEDLVIGSSGTFVINPKYTIVTDYERFESACKKFCTEKEPAERDNAFQAAKEIYSGILLPRCDHIHWFIPRIAYYHTLFIGLMKRYLSHLLAEDNYFLIQKIAMEGLEAEPYDTDFMTYQIIGMCALGNRSISRSYYKRIETQLTDEQKRMIKPYMS